ncbi:hypothetical protein [Sphaerisporangium aureirubrum]|uniref:Allene oxide cyclase barrel-like domain-containing protein n=1 Tax=Sphaerisporangium aureirubrum TaxID=1544736 RepID=A0ABW1NWW0_9ACTN
MVNVVTELLDPNAMSRYLSGVADVEDAGDLYEIETDADGWVGTGDNGIAIDDTDGERFLIKYELWDGAPPPLASWDDSWSGSVRLESGKVRAVSQYSGDESYGAEFDLGRPEAAWQVRVHRKYLRHEEFTADVVGVTLLKLQFWPAAQA